MPQFLKILWIRINYKLLALHWWDSNLQPVKKVLLKIGALIRLVTLPTLWIRYSKKKFGCCNALGSSGGLLLETDICAIEHTYCSFKNAAYTMLVFLYHSIRWFFFGGGMSSLGKFVIFYLKIDSPYEIIIQEEGSWQHSGLLAISIPLSWFIDKLGTNM